MTEELLVNIKVRLEKYPGKGGWTYAALPGVSPDKHNHFGWVRVKGFIEDYEIKQYHLMPMGNGKLFLPVKAAIRKILKKEAGDIVHVKLFKDNSSLEIPEDFLECLRDEPDAFNRFQQMYETEKKRWIDYIKQARSDDARTERMASCINSIVEGKLVP